MSLQICKLCHESPAETVFRATAGGVETVISLCRPCDQKVRQWAAAFQQWQRVVQTARANDPLHPWLNPEHKEYWDRARRRRCSSCRMMFDNFMTKGLLGCASCYAEFRDLLEPILRRMHGMTHMPEFNTHRPVLHASADPLFPGSSIQLELHLPTREELEMDLQLALLEEDYERAARLRDQIKTLSEQL